MIKWPCFNPRTPRGVRRYTRSRIINKSEISIHAPREGCDPFSVVRHAGPVRFQSTHPARGATLYPNFHKQHDWISIHAPREGCDQDGETCRHTRVISIHAPREGCDLHIITVLLRGSIFQSTHPARGATPVNSAIKSVLSISIHAPREGCDPALRACLSEPGVISIHAPREGCDSTPVVPSQKACHFNPRTPRGVRQQTLPKSREFAWLNLLICTRGRRLSIQKQTRLCSIKLSFMLFGCEPAGEGVSSWTSHATKSKVRLEGRSAYSQSARSSAHSDFPGNKSGDCPVRGP